MYFIYCCIFSLQTYASIASTLLISLPFQVFTFIRWNTRPWGETTVLKSLSLKQRVAIILGFFVSSFVLWRILSLTDANHVLLDSIVFILGLLNSTLTLFAYIEYTWFMLLSTIMNMFLYVSMIFAGNSEQVPYLVFSIYSIVCMCVAFKKANILYKLQQEELKYESQKSN